KSVAGHQARRIPSISGCTVTKDRAMGPVAAPCTSSAIICLAPGGGLQEPRTFPGQRGVNSPLKEGRAMAEPIEEESSRNAMRAAPLRPDVNEVAIIAPNFKVRLSGVTSTVVRLVPVQAQHVPIASS